jgi:hypothetical protein
MTSKPNIRRKPSLLVLLAFSVGVGVLATGIAQAADTPGQTKIGTHARAASGNEKWWRSIWGLDLAGKLREWRPMITANDDGEGFNIARPFGKSGPTIQCSSSLPDSAVRSLRAGGGPGIETYARDTDIFVFVQKRW